MFDYQRLLAELPNDWHTLPIEDIGEVISGGTPSRDNPRYWGGEIPWVTPGEVTGFGRKHLEETDEKITAEGLAQSGAKLLPANSLLVTTRASLGAAVLNAAPASTNQGFKSIAFTKHFSPDYYYHWSTKLKDELVRLASGTTFLEIPGSHFRKIVVPAPPRAEQRLIARILDTLDTQIHKTEALIAKLEKVKEGLLHDLLTRGTDESGRLRPSPEQAPELYKESPLGLIPSSWASTTLGSISEIKSGTTPSRAVSPYWAGGTIPWIKTAEVNFGAIQKIREKITEKAVNQIGLRIFPVNTILVAMYGQGLTRGRSAILKTPATINQACAAIIANTEHVSPDYLFQYLRHTYSELRKIGHGSNQTNLSSSLLSSFEMPLPSLIEQSRIASMLNQLDKRLAEEKRMLSKLKLKKRGLMDDLLTGRVRVMPLLDQAQATTPA